MATPINSPLTSEIWHLSIDDLLEPISESPRLGGPGPFVINLSASSAPLSQPAKTFAPPAGAYVYQIQRTEDRRPRYRLRLGPFATEDEADETLRLVRDVYPSALTATADSDDLRTIAALKPKTDNAPAPAAPRTAEVPHRPAAAVEVGLPAQPAAPRNMAAPQRGVSPAAVPPEKAPPVIQRTRPMPAAPSIPVLSDFVEPAPRAAAPLRSAVPVELRVPVVTQAHTKPSLPPTPSNVQPPPVTANPTAPSRPEELRRAAPPSLESTQTLRPLTSSELKDSASRWYVIQLSLSGESFDPDSLPNLDIFNEYRLYSVAGLDQGRIVHALRLGFFAEEGAAAAVASYLGGFYDKPTVKRISVAERERFRDQRVEARKDIGATGRHAVIEITGERHIRDNRPRIATVTPLAPAAAFSQSAATPARRR